MGPAQRVYFHERNKIDVVAVECPDNLDNDCWHGLYRTTLALELENDIQEFELTMRWLLDVRAELHCGVFFAKSLDGLLVGGSHHQHKPTKIQVPLATWTPPWHHDRGDWVVPAAGNEKLLAIFLSDQEPKLLGARLYEPGKDVTPIGPSVHPAVAGA
jgi:hypothetical protein